MKFNARARSILLYGTIALYIGSLFLPGLTTTYGASQYGFEVLLVGWLGIFSGVFSWYGYVLGIVCFILLLNKKKSTSIIFSAIAFLFALQALYLQMVNARINFFDSYNSWERGMGELSVGYYVWLFALGLLVIQSFVAKMSHRKEQA